MIYLFVKAAVSGVIIVPEDHQLGFHAPSSKLNRHRKRDRPTVLGCGHGGGLLIQQALR